MRNNVTRGMDWEKTLLINMLSHLERDNNFAERAIFTSTYKLLAMLMVYELWTIKHFLVEINFFIPLPIVSYLFFSSYHNYCTSCILHKSRNVLPDAIEPKGPNNFLRGCCQKSSSLGKKVKKTSLSEIHDKTIGNPRIRISLELGYYHGSVDDSRAANVFNII